MSLRKDVKNRMNTLASEVVTTPAIWFKDSYSAHDVFTGVRVPDIRKLAKEFEDISLTYLQTLIKSKINEERLLVLIILTNKYKTGDDAEKLSIYNFYLKNLKYVSNWNLVDASAHLIMGEYLLNRKKDILLSLVKSENLWERRIAIVATWQFIRNGKYSWTLNLAKMLINDEHDLIHKASGWMLREVGKRDLGVLRGFLDKYYSKMPRTMLRYSIEKFSEKERLSYLKR